jgi:hypothetical protein
MAKAPKTHKQKKDKSTKGNNSSVSSTDGLKKLSIVVGILSVLLFAVFAATAGGGGAKKSSDVKDATAQSSRVIPKYANPEGKPMEAEEGCEDRNENCQSFAARGECGKSIGWMVVNCPASCGTCHLRDASVRCNRDTLNTSHTKALEPQSLHSMFDRLEHDPALSNKFKGVNVLSRSPFVVTIDDFMTSEEADALISAGGVKWERSTDTGTSNKFGETGRVLSEKRTSSNSWCRDECLANPYVQR